MVSFRKRCYNIKGRVVNKIQGYYYVDYEGQEIECRLRGTLKKKNKKDNCIVGDIVEFDEGVITKVYDRINLIKRPLVANIDYLVITFSAKDPNFDINRFNLLLLNAFHYEVKPIVVINKIELLGEDELETLKKQLDFLEKLEIKIIWMSTYKNINIEELENFLKDKLSALGGPSGVGKSSLINLLQDQITLEVGETSKKISRGRHTTKGTRLLSLKKGGYIIDTPGFSSLEIPPIESPEELMDLFPEFYEFSCKFSNCIHVNEPSCGIKEAVNKNKISQIRYEFYKKIYELLKEERWNNYD